MVAHRRLKPELKIQAQAQDPSLAEAQTRAVPIHAVRKQGRQEVRSI